MKRFHTLAIVPAVLAFGITSAAAQNTNAGAKGPKAQTHAPKAQNGQPARAKGADASAAAKAAKAERTHKAPKATNTTASPTTSPGPNAIAAKIAKNPDQLARIQAMLPTGMTVEDAAAGFRNQGQFIAALNASKNRNLSFTDLKAAMTVDGLSLGQAAKQLQPEHPVTTGTPRDVRD